MNHDRPTLAELRLKVFKHCRPGGREIGNWLARRWGRPAAVYGTWVAVRCRVSAHAVTSLAVAAQGVGCAAIGTGSRWGFVVGVVLIHLAYWLDHVDGQVARWRGTASLSGVYFDYLYHHAASLMLGFALGFGLLMREREPLWALGGFSLAGGWVLLGLNHDCRYKAFFQRLKSESGTFEVRGGSGGRPEAPEPWPRRWPGVVSWPASKVCEPHVVLMVLTGLGVLAALGSGLWERGWRVFVGVEAPVALGLAVVRVARTIGRGVPDRDFEAWFRPVSGGEERSGPSGLEIGREVAGPAELADLPEADEDRLGRVVA